MQVYISTDPFSSTSSEPINQLKYNGFEYRKNEFGRKITTDELAEEIGNSEILIAGTEKITTKVLERATKLKLISRVGIGLDGIDFDLCKKFGIKVCYTPDAPTLAVAEITVGLMLDLARRITQTNENLKKNAVWHRHMGMLLNGKNIGLFGMGRIGKTVIHLLSSFNVKFLVNDPSPDFAFARLHNVEIVTKTELLKFSDIVSIHVPLNSTTLSFITLDDLKLMKKDSFLINTARGGIINEDHLAVALKKKMIAGAAIDVFENEPYAGALTEIDSTILTCHMGASTQESRSDMEIQAVQEAIRYKRGEPLKNEVFGN